MPRPYQPIKRLKAGSDVYYIQIRDTAGKRHSLSLETTDKETAMRRYGQAMKLLLSRIKAKEEGASSRQQWSDEQIEDIKQQWPEDFTAQDIAEQVTGKRTTDPATGEFTDKSTQALAERLHGIKPALTWHDLIKEAESRRLQNEGKPYSPGWYEAIEITIKDCPGSAT